MHNEHQNNFKNDAIIRFKTQNLKIKKQASMYQILHYWKKYAET